MRTAWPRCSTPFTAEPPNGWIKNALSFRQFSMRGLAKTQAEWQFVCAALNLRKMAKLGLA